MLLRSLTMSEAAAASAAAPPPRDAAEDDDNADQSEDGSGGEGGSDDGGSGGSGGSEGGGGEDDDIVEDGFGRRRKRGSKASRILAKRRAERAKEKARAPPPAKRRRAAASQPTGDGQASRYIETGAEEAGGDDEDYDEDDMGAFAAGRPMESSEGLAARLPQWRLLPGYGLGAPSLPVFSLGVGGFLIRPIPPIMMFGASRLRFYLRPGRKAEWHSTVILTGVECCVSLDGYLPSTMMTLRCF